MDPLLLFRPQLIFTKHHIQRLVQAVLYVPMPSYRDREHLHIRGDTAQIIPLFHLLFPGSLLCYGFSLITYGRQLFPSFPVFKPQDVIGYKIFSLDDHICCMFGFSYIPPFLTHKVFQEFLAAKVFFYFLIRHLLVFLQCQAVLPVPLLHDCPGSCFLGVHGICCYDAATAVDLLYDLLHFRDFIALFVNPCGGQAECPIPLTSHSIHGDCGPVLPPYSSFWPYCGFPSYPLRSHPGCSTPGHHSGKDIHPGISRPHGSAGSGCSPAFSAVRPGAG